MFKKNRTIYICLLLCVSVVLLFQNCSNARFSPIQEVQNSVTTMGTPTPDPVDGFQFSKSTQISSQPYKVDFLLIIDNSDSMQEDAVALGQKLSNFFLYLNSAQIDWQMCVVTTNANTYGKSYPWLMTNSNPIINSKTPNLHLVVPNTIEYFFSTAAITGDERGIAQSYLHMKNASNSNCYRDQALFAPIIISDEDERSTGVSDYSYVSTNPEFVNQSTGPIEDIDRPEYYLQAFSSQFPGKKIQAHAIVIKTGDVACFNEQDYYANVSYGKFYEKLASLSQGTVTSICEADYNKNLNQISAKIVSLSQNLQLDCAPTRTPNVAISPFDSAVTYKLIDRSLALSYPSNKSYSVTVNYSCK